MKTVLLAEDDPISRAFLAEALHHLGWHCTAVASAAAAIQAGTSRHFDALVLDLNLGDGDGLQVLRQLRDRDTHPCADTPALALSAAHDTALQTRLRQAGFDAVAEKPISLACLQQQMQALQALASPLPEHGDADTEAPPADWDDASALSALGGQRQTLQALRQLLLQELPGQCRLILAEPHSEASAHCLHRLRAATGFCGAARLQQAVLDLQQHPTPEALDAFAAACRALLEQS